MGKVNEYPSFVIEDGRIAEASDPDLYLYWLRNFSDFMPYSDYKKKCMELGTKIVEEENGKMAESAGSI
jgi:hypothetical protein